MTSIWNRQSNWRLWKIWSQCKTDSCVFFLTWTRYPNLISVKILLHLLNAKKRIGHFYSCQSRFNPLPVPNHKFVPLSVHWPISVHFPVLLSQSTPSTRFRSKVETGFSDRQIIQPMTTWQFLNDGCLENVATNQRESWAGLLLQHSFSKVTRDRL